jgi:glyoxylase-like metal-dependent hydrolase (beta-lactamase superfamily II)
VGQPVGVVTTHAHPDHFAALGSVVAITEVDTMASAADAGKIDPHPTRIVANGECIKFGASRVEVIELRGHTEAGIALVYGEGEEPPIVITGDSLFLGVSEKPVVGGILIS